MAKWYKILWAMLGTHEVAQIVMSLVMSGKSRFKWIHFHNLQLDTWQIMAKMVQLYVFLAFFRII